MQHVLSRGCILNGSLNRVLPPGQSSIHGRHHGLIQIPRTVPICFGQWTRQKRTSARAGVVRRVIISKSAEEQTLLNASAAADKEISSAHESSKSSSESRYLPHDVKAPSRGHRSSSWRTSDKQSQHGTILPKSGLSKDDVAASDKRPDVGSSWHSDQRPVMRLQRTGEPRPKKYDYHFYRKDIESANAETSSKSFEIETEQMKQLSLNLVYGFLHESARVGQLEKTYEIAYHLLEQRLQSPSREIFHALILANASPEGSVDRVMHLLEELNQENIPLDQSLCNAILRVLAVHPDHVLRIEILQHMERRWLGLSADTHHLIIASLFRTLQLEQGMHEVHMMRANNLKVEEWLYALAISILVEVEEFDEAMKLMRTRLEDLGNEETTALWTHLIDSAADAHHYITCRYIWLRCVKAEYINVSSGTCMHLLTIAARKGDVDFALDIVRVIKRHHFEMLRSHWELLVETYATAGLLERAFDTVVEMANFDVPTRHLTTRPIYSALKVYPEEQRDDRCLELYDYLLNRHATVGRDVPIAAVNVLLESCTQAQSAYDMYQGINMVCRYAPNANTFHCLFAFTIQQKDAKRALAYAREHSLMKMAPDLVVYDGLLMSLIQGKHDIEETMHIYDEMCMAFRYPIFRTMAALYIALRVHGHPRAPEVFAGIRRLESEKLPGELPLRLQNLRMDAAAEVARTKGRRVDSSAHALSFPPQLDDNLQIYIEDLQRRMKHTADADLVKLTYAAA